MELKQKGQHLKCEVNVRASCVLQHLMTNADLYDHGCVHDTTPRFVIHLDDAHLLRICSTTPKFHVGVVRGRSNSPCT